MRGMFSTVAGPKIKLWNGQALLVMVKDGVATHLTDQALKAKFE